MSDTAKKRDIDFLSNFDDDEEEAEDIKSKLDDDEQDDNDDQDNSEEDEEEDEKEDSEEDEDKEKHKKENEDDEISVTTRIKRPKQKRKTRKPKIKEESSQTGYSEISEMIDLLSPGSATGVFVTISRVEPKIFKGKRIEGHITRFEEKFEIDEIKQMYGGGVYDLAFYGPKKMEDGIPSGTKIIGRRRIRIAGDPVIDTEEKEKKKKEQESGIVEQTLTAQERMLERERLASEKSQERFDKMVEKMFDGSGKNNEMLDMLKMQIDQSEASLRMKAEENKQLREEALKREETLRREMKEIREHMKAESQSQMLPMLEFMKMQVEKSKEDSSSQLKMMLMLFQTMNESQKAQMNTQISMLQESNKANIEILTNELRRVSEEAKELRVNSKSDLTTELRKLKMVKELAGLISGEGESKSGFMDKIAEKLPDLVESLPEVISMMKGGGIPKIQQPPQHQQIQQPQQAQQTHQNQNQQQPQQEEISDDEQRIVQYLIKFKNETEQAVLNGEDPEKYTKEKIMKEYDRDILEKMAEIPTVMIYQMIEKNFNDPDSPLLSVKGKQFLKKVHSTLKSELKS